MTPEKLIAFIALGWLVGALLLMGRSIRRGRVLAETFAARYPETYEALGRPRPGYLHSARRSRFAQFLAQREFERIADPMLSAQFEAYRKSDMRLVLSLLVSLVVLVLLLFAARHAA